MHLVITLVLFSLAMASAAVGQSVDPGEFYRQHAGELAQPVFGPQAEKVGERTATAPEAAKYVTLRVNNMYPQVGDRLVATLLGLSNQSDAFSLVGRLTRYDEETKLSSSKFFYPRVCGQGYCNLGLGFGGAMEVFSTQISEADARGDYALDFALYGASGHLLQQVFVYYYVGAPSIFGRHFLQIDSASITHRAPEQATVVITGNFPKNEPIVFWVGNIMLGNGWSGTVVSYDGKTIVLGFALPNREIPFDVVLLSPGNRTSVTLPNGLVLPPKRVI